MNDKDKIKENNLYVLDLMKKGGDMAKIPNEETWFPPRGVFDKEKGKMVAVNNQPKTEIKKPFLRLVKDDEC
jgi:hypothetical protein